MSNVSRRNFKTNFFGPKFTASMSIIINQSMIAIHFWSFIVLMIAILDVDFCMLLLISYNPYPFRG